MCEQRRQQKQGALVTRKDKTHCKNFDELCFVVTVYSEVSRLAEQLKRYFSTLNCAACNKSTQLCVPHIACSNRCCQTFRYVPCLWFVIRESYYRPPIEHLPGCVCLCVSVPECVSLCLYARVYQPTTSRVLIIVERRKNIISEEMHSSLCSDLK